MRALAMHSPERVIDLLAERRLVARSAVALYDAIAGKLERSNDERLLDAVRPLLIFRDEEREHDRWLADTIGALGADPDAITGLARIAAFELSGIARIVVDGDDDPMHLMHALRAAELADVAGWELLAALACEARDHEARLAFAQRAREDRAHVTYVTRVVTRIARAGVLGS